MIILLVGPHRAGKTTLGRAASKVLASVKFVDLDEVIQDHYARPVLDMWNSLGPARFADICCTEVARLSQESGNDLTIVAVGAGVFFDSAGDTSWLGHYPKVAVTGDPQHLFQRSPAFHSMEEFLIRQFSPAQVRVYDAADLQIDTTSQSEKESIRNLEAWIKKIKSAPNSPLDVTTCPAGGPS